ncbi:hypothetical protein ACIBJI_34700 [Nocardia sp. NPDC050408]|uniref:hypothetical protein n=1 Tax=Nocardia sp. NPDC050408 TaxID=3364319 RepID=UPI0037B3FC8C
MDKNVASRRARGTRSPEVVARLERSRARIRDRRDAARKREQAVTGEVRRYIAAWQAITRIEEARDDNIAALQQQIAAARERAAAEIEEHRHRQALAAARIREQGNTDDDVADLLEITPKQARQLVAAADDATKTRDPDVGARRDGMKTGAPGQRFERGLAADPESMSAAVEVSRRVPGGGDSAPTGESLGQSK